jgi:hypothetical protein
VAITIFGLVFFTLFLAMNIYWLGKYLHNVRDIKTLSEKLIIEKNTIYPTLAGTSDFFESRIVQHGSIRISSVDRTVPVKWLRFQPTCISDKQINEFIDRYQPDVALIFYYNDVFIQYALLSETQGLVTAPYTRHISGVGLMRFEHILRKLFNARCQCYVTTESRIDVESLIKQASSSVFVLGVEACTKLSGFRRSDLESFLENFNHDTGLFYGLSSFKFENEGEA